MYRELELKLHIGVVLKSKQAQPPECVNYSIANLLRGNIDDAMQGASQEWASIALPRGRKDKRNIISDGSRSYYESNTNHASLKSTRAVKEILEKIYQYHHR